MKGVRKNSANDTSNLEGTPKVAGMQIKINTVELAREKRLAEEGRRRDISIYIRKCLTKGESIEEVLRKGRLYALKIGGNPESVTRKAIERFARDLGLEEEER